MKKLLYLALLGLPVFASAQPVTSVTNGTDLALRSIGGTVSATLGPLSESISLPPSTLAHIAKAAGTLNTSFNLETLFPGLGISSVVTATGMSSSSSSTIIWSITDSSAVGTTFSVPYKGTNFSVKITGVTGSIVVLPQLVKTPIYDPFNAIYRTETLEPTTENTSSITISGTTTYANVSVPVTLEFKPALAGIGGTAPANFVKYLTMASSSVLGGSNFTYKVTLNEPAGAGGATVYLAGVPFTGPASVLFPEGAQAEYVTASAPLEDTPKPAHLTASLNGYYCDVAMTVVPLISSVVAETSPAIGGAPVGMRLTTSVPVPTGGATIYLRSDDPNVILPASITLTAGQTYYDFLVYTKTPTTAYSTAGVTYLDVTAIYGATYVRASVALH